jgi:poly-gamma-glutamate capsule biosynthesis protein CapA/YwtB (metallophosphatase superfamily)
MDQSFTFLSSFAFTRAIFWFKLVGPSEYYNDNTLLYTLDDGLFNQDGTQGPATTVFQTFSTTNSIPEMTNAILAATIAITTITLISLKRKVPKRNK